MAIPNTPPFEISDAAESTGITITKSQHEGKERDQHIVLYKLINMSNVATSSRFLFYLTAHFFWYTVSSVMPKH